MQLAPLSAVHVLERQTFVSLATAVSLPRAVNASPLVRPTLLQLLEHVLLVIRIVRPALGLRSVNVPAAHRIDRYFPTAVVFQPAPRRSSSTGPVEAASHATAAVRVVLAQGPATVSRVSVRPRSSAEDPVRRQTAAGMQRPLYSDWVYASRISSPSPRCRAPPSQFRCPPSRASTRRR